jgi:Uma2 family endonuclease
MTLNLISVLEFDEWVNLPENQDRTFEFIGGEIVEVTPSNIISSAIGGFIYGELHIFTKGKQLGVLSSEQGGYMVSGERYVPDVAFIRKQKRITKDGYNPAPPDLAVEVDYPSSVTSLNQLRVKTSNYLAEGILVWLVFPEKRIIEVHQAGQPVRVLTEKDTLTGGDVLPGFQLAVRDIFAELEPYMEE